MQRAFQQFDEAVTRHQKYIKVLTRARSANDNAVKGVMSNIGRDARSYSYCFDDGQRAPPQSNLPHCLPCPHLLADDLSGGSSLARPAPASTRVVPERMKLGGSSSAGV